MAKVKVPGLSKNKGQVSSGFHLKDGDYPVEAQSMVFSWKPRAGQKPGEDGCPYQYTLKLSLLGGPEQEDGKDPAGRPWTVFLYIDPDHEYTELMVSRLKNCINAFGVQVTGDSFSEGSFENKQAVMRIINKKRKGDDEIRSEVQEWLPVSD